MATLQTGTPFNPNNSNTGTGLTPSTTNFNQYNQGYQDGLNAAIASLNTANNGKTFSQLNVATDVKEKQIKIISRGIWTNDSSALTTFWTGSQTSTQQAYFYSVWDGNPFTSGSLSQFAVSYGHRAGSGSATTAASTERPTKAIYSQMKLVALSPGDSVFTFNSGSTTQNSNSIYALTINRARIKDSLDPGNWEMYLATLSGSAVPNNVHTGSNVRVKGDGSTISVIDDSSITTSVDMTNAGARYNIISGSINGGAYVNASGRYDYYGLAYPALGLLIYNGTTLDEQLGFNTVSGSTSGDNAYKLYTSISGAAAISSTKAFTARNNEKTVSSHYFVRLKNGDFNYSNNTTFVTGSDGALSNIDFVADPQVFITTIGLYNSKYELLAVAKLSRPLLKNFETEQLVKVKLNF